ncbi:hypothetical protein GWG65_13755 [Bradyrhizobium sp. CSA207]|uniref:hypothetical protein n=1 Tax=Bradyrhizobium sp. CSA207 TaxID=2698826 RepID=UPI0023B1E11F|nr:hypothetical protein [Bradyrhizobium sp. CSA207]MDE5442496.1 hypothetical protein [Bradyrhizobium sp. CSA207]
MAGKSTSACEHYVGKIGRLPGIGTAVWCIFEREGKRHYHLVCKTSRSPTQASSVFLGLASQQHVEKIAGVVIACTTIRELVGARLQCAADGVPSRVAQLRPTTAATTDQECIERIQTASRDNIRHHACGRDEPSLHKSEQAAEGIASNSRFCHRHFPEKGKS